MSQENNIPKISRAELEDALKKEEGSSSHHMFECYKLMLQTKEHTPSLLKQQLNSEIENRIRLEEEIENLKHIVNNQRRLIKFARFKFPDVKTDKKEDSEVVCRMCGIWCYGRYNDVYGYWLLTPDEEPPYPKDGNEGLEKISICDECFKDGDPHCLDTIIVLERQFIVDNVERINP